MSWEAIAHAKVRLAAKHADPIRKALAGSVDVATILSAWVWPEGHKITSEDARVWAARHVTVETESLRKALTTLYGEAWVMGDNVALHTFARKTLSKKATAQELSDAFAINWETWQPGNAAAAALVDPPGGLATLLGQRDLTIKGITGTTLDRLGTALATGLDHGWSVDQLGRSIRDIVGSADRAVTIANTEMARATCAASLDSYAQLGVEQVEWLVAWGDACDDCQANADQGPVNLGDEFESGDDAPPAHPNCLCDVAPTIDASILGGAA